ncbi:MAG: hypothetical protein IPJ65_42025 [Archangiaceae bacterium]|nr:hypothetical protein [Archangiaceae bacterium]
MVPSGHAGTQTVAGAARPGAKKIEATASTFTQVVPLLGLAEFSTFVSKVER